VGKRPVATLLVPVSLSTPELAESTVPAHPARVPALVPGMALRECVAWSCQTERIGQTTVRSVVES
jgi:hypothetical protein